jgi:ferrochelatase
MRRYLKEFLSDRRVIETNRLLWWVILNGIVLSFRPQKSAHAYDKIWNRERNESPLKTITRAQSEKLAERFFATPDIVVDWAMRYGYPAMGDRLKALIGAGCQRILLFPLYPQYSAATTATALDKAFDALKALRLQPAIRTVPPYFDNSGYIDGLARSLEKHLASIAWKPDLILASYHGLPQSYVDAGDPYYDHCVATTKLLAQRLALPPEKLQIVFQSRFGKTEWLKPYAQEIVEGLAARGVKNLTIIMPGFAADCVETLEEVAIGLKETFHGRGGLNFSTAPCLNDAPESIDMLESIARRELAGWL